MYARALSVKIEGERCVVTTASSKLGASFYVKPRLGLLPSEWVAEGTWKPEATGTGSVTSSLGGAPGASVQCALPRIEVKALLAGSAGPYLAISPVASMAGPSPEFKATVSAGLQANVLGAGCAVEVTLLT